MNQKVIFIVFMCVVLLIASCIGVQFYESHSNKAIANSQNEAMVTLIHEMNTMIDKS